MKQIFIVISLFTFCASQAQTKKTSTVAHSETKKITVTKSATGSKGTVAPKNSIDSFSYALGLNIAANLHSQGIENVNYASMQKAMMDVFNKKNPLLTENEAKMAIQNKLMKYMNEKNAPQRQFLAENKKRPGVIELPSGLQYEIIKQGTGDKPKATDTVKAHYALSLINGQEIESSYKGGQPLVIPVNRVIPGWTEALQLMPVGSKWKLYIPSDLGYGDRGAGAAIPGGATLIFDIELLEIVHSK